MAESGETPQEAYLRFVGTFKSILSDIANESSGFDNFEQGVRQFFCESDATEEGRWCNALEAIRSGRMIPQPPFAALPKQPADSPRFVSVERLDRDVSFSAGNSRYDSIAIPIAA